MKDAPLDPKQVHQLIGGYATGTLTDAEREALFAEALNNQTLFDALADEEALRELLADPASRRQLLAALEPKRPAFTERISGWLFRPLTMAMAAGAAAAALAVILIPRVAERPRQEIAMRQEAPVPSAAAPAVSEQPAPASRQPENDRAAPRKQLPDSASSDNRVASAGAAAPPPAPKPLTAAAPPVPPAQPASPEPLADSRKSEEKERQVQVAPKAVASSPAPAAVSPAPAPPAVVGGVLAEPQQQQLRSSLAKTSAVVAPFEYLVERQVREGVWAGVDAAAPLDKSDIVRISVQANAPGYLRAALRAPSGAVSVLYTGPVVAGVRLHLPAQGSLSGQSGENRLTIAHSATAPGNLSISGFRGPARTAVSSRAKKDNNTREAASAETRRDEVSQDSSQPYSVEIPLRFR